MRASALRVIALLMLPGIAGAASFMPLGTLQGSLPTGPLSSFARAVSYDGSVVVGRNYSESAIGGRSEAFRWTSDGGMVPLGDLAGGEFSSSAWGVSGNGDVVVGIGDTPGGSSEAFQWTSTGGMVGLGYLPGGGLNGGAFAASGDGSVITGASAVQHPSDNREGFRWTADGGMVQLVNALGLIGSEPRAISADGSVIAGTANTLPSFGLGAFIWTQESGMVGLGDLPGGDFLSEAHAISADGAIVVGRSRGDSDNRDQAFSWSAATGMVAIDSGGVSSSEAHGVSDDGSVIVGFSGNDAVVWTPTGGMLRLFDILVAEGATGLAGWQIHMASGVSGDGTSVVGYATDPFGQRQAYVATFSVVPIPPAVLLFGSALGLMGVMRRKISS